jgi:hypothetical protein
MSDEDTDTTEVDTASTSTPEPAAENRSGLTIPTWLAAALVGLLGLALALGGFAVGRATADDGGRGFAPIAVQRQGGGPRGQLPGGGRGESGPMGGGPGTRGPGNQGPGNGGQSNQGADPDGT